VLAHTIALALHSMSIYISHLCINHEHHTWNMSMQQVKHATKTLETFPCNIMFQTLVILCFSTSLFGLWVGVMQICAKYHNNILFMFRIPIGIKFVLVVWSNSNSISSWPCWPSRVL
jgi:hypothetical protein